MIVFIDTDPGKDDALAIALAYKSYFFNIKAITTVAGNSTIENTTKNARFIVNLLNAKIPIYSGSKKPLKKELKESIIQGPGGLEGIKNNFKPNITNNAVDKILEIIKNNPNKISIIALAPLTNLAKAMKRDSKTMKKLRQIIMMGGAINVKGNQSEFAEFNFFTDPEAAKIVLEFPIKKILLPLDVCNTILMQLKDFEKIENKEIRKFVLKIMESYIPKTYAEEGINGALMYDPLTIYSLLKPKNCEKQFCFLKIKTKGKKEGQVVKNISGSKIEVIKKINEIKFKKDFIEILSKKETLLNSKPLNKLVEKGG